VELRVGRKGALVAGKLPTNRSTTERVELEGTHTSSSDQGNDVRNLHLEGDLGNKNGAFSGVCENSSRHGREPSRTYEIERTNPW